MELVDEHALQAAIAATHPALGFVNKDEVNVRRSMAPCYAQVACKMSTACLLMRSSPACVAASRAQHAMPFSSTLPNPVALRQPSSSFTHLLSNGRGVPLRVAANESAPASTSQEQQTVWLQRTITLPQHSRGCHLITKKVYEAIPEVQEFEVGLCNIFLLHTSASLTINENASPDVREDLNASLDRIAPEGTFYTHSDEGPDDMPAHVKSSLMGAGLCVPVAKGKLALGTWQGVYLNEHRNAGGSRSIMVTLQGLKRSDGRKYGPIY